MGEIKSCHPRHKFPLQKYLYERNIPLYAIEHVRLYGLEESIEMYKNDAIPLFERLREETVTFPDRNDAIVSDLEFFHQVLEFTKTIESGDFQYLEELSKKFTNP